MAAIQWTATHDAAWRRTFGELGAKSSVWSRVCLPNKHGEDHRDRSRLVAQWRQKHFADEPGLVFKSGSSGQPQGSICLHDGVEALLPPGSNGSRQCLVNSMAANEAKHVFDMSTCQSNAISPLRRRYVPHFKKRQVSEELGHSSRS